MSLLAIEKLKVAFITPIGKVHAVNGVSLELREGETLALTGETGCGKSTIAHSILNLLPENAIIHGKITYQNQNLLLLTEREMARVRGKEISLIMQNPSLALNPVLSIGHQITEPLILHGRLKKNGSYPVSERPAE